MNVNNCLDSDMEDIGQIESYYVANDEKSSAGCAASALCLPAAASVQSWIIYTELQYVQATNNTCPVLNHTVFSLRDTYSCIQMAHVQHLATN